MIKKSKPVLLSTPYLNVFIIGAGKNGIRKALNYVKAGAKVTVIDKQSATFSNPPFLWIQDDVDQWILNHDQIWQTFHLIILCTDDRALHQRIILKCEATGKLYNDTMPKGKRLFSDMAYKEDQGIVYAASSSPPSPFSINFLLNQFQKILKEPTVSQRIHLLRLGRVSLKEKKISYQSMEKLSLEELERIIHENNH